MGTNNMTHHFKTRRVKVANLRKQRDYAPIFSIYKQRSLSFETKLKMNLKTTIISTLLSVLSLLISQTACIVVRPTKPYVDCTAKQSVMEMTGPERMQCYISQSPNPDGFRQCIRDSQHKAYDYQYSEWTHRQQAIDEWLRPWFLDCLRARGAYVPQLEEAYKKADIQKGLLTTPAPTTPNPDAWRMDVIYDRYRDNSATNMDLYPFIRIILPVVAAIVWRELYKANNWKKQIDGN